MINWNDPDYVSAGHFYATIKSVSVVCEDPTPAGASVSSYVYGKNTTSLTPSIAFSNLTTINGAFGSLAGLDSLSGLRLSVMVALLCGLFGVML